MRKILILSLLCALTLCVHARKSKTSGHSTKHNATVYMFGVSASFNDSTVYFTGVQEVDSAYYVKKMYLGGYKEYADQLNGYLLSKTGERRTNVVFFKKKRAKAEKAYAKLRKRYTNSGVVMKEISADEFKFKGVRPEEE